ncbi:cytochrome b5 [Pilaira anomala]|nr:cytochrome b5 [Pilaira anomala]
MATIYSADEVSKHNKKNDLWMTIHNKVYNVTEFIIEEVLLDEAGKDATESFEDIGHSDEAREILSKYLVGELDEASRSVRTDYNKLRAGELPCFACNLPALAVIGIIAYKFILAPKQV